MAQPGMKVAAIVLVALMASVLTVGCASERPEYDRTYRPASLQQPQEWSPPREQPQQPQEPAYPREQDDDHGQSDGLDAPAW